MTDLKDLPESTLAVDGPIGSCAQCGLFHDRVVYKLDHEYVPRDDRVRRINHLLNLLETVRQQHLSLLPNPPGARIQHNLSKARSALEDIVATLEGKNGLGHKAGDRGDG